MVFTGIAAAVADVGTAVGSVASGIGGALGVGAADAGAIGAADAGAIGAVDAGAAAAGTVGGLSDAAGAAATAADISGAAGPALAAIDTGAAGTGAADAALGGAAALGTDATALGGVGAGGFNLAPLAGTDLTGASVGIPSSATALGAAPAIGAAATPLTGAGGGGGAAGAVAPAGVAPDISATGAFGTDLSTIPNAATPIPTPGAPPVAPAGVTSAAGSVGAPTQLAGERLAQDRVRRRFLRRPPPDRRRRPPRPRHDSFDRQRGRQLGERRPELGREESAGNSQRRTDGLRTFAGKPAASFSGSALGAGSAGSGARKSARLLPLVWDAPSRRPIRTYGGARRRGGDDQGAIRLARTERQFGGGARPVDARRDDGQPRRLDRHKPA